MSDDQLDPYRERLDRANAALGWQRREVEVDHERDWQSWTEAAVHGPDGHFLFAENRLTEGMVREIIRLAELPALAVR